MVTIKLRQLLSLRSTSTSINSGGDMSTYDIDNDLNEAQDDLAASIANRELLLTAAAMKHTNNSSSEDSIRVLSNEIKMLRDEMRERFDVLEKKFTINFDNSVNSDVSMDSKCIKYEGGEVLSSHLLEEKLELVSKEVEDWTEVTSNQKVVLSGMPTAVGKDDLKRVKRKKLKKKQVKGKHRQKNKIQSPAFVSSEGGEVLSSHLLEEKLELVSKEVEDWTEVTSNQKVVLSGMPTAVGKDDLKRVKRKKLKKKQVKGKHRQKNKIQSPAFVSSSVNPSGNGTLTILVTLINAFPTLLLMRGGKRLYMLLAFIAASYLFKDEMNNFSGIPNEASVSDDNSIGGGWFTIGSSFSFIQGVRALEDCPEQYIAADIDSYDIGSKVTIEEKVYECTESPCGWKVIGTCVGNMFLPSSASAQPTIQTLGMPVHFPSMMPSALDTDSDESNLFESESVPAESSLGRVRIHSIQEETRQGLFGDDDDESTQAALYYPDYVLAKCVTESSTIFDSSQSSATIEECCDQW